MTLQQQFEILSEDLEVSLYYKAKNRVRMILDHLELLLRESLEEKKKFLIGAFYFLPDEIISLIEETEFKLETISSGVQLTSAEESFSFLGKKKKQNEKTKLAKHKQNPKLSVSFLSFFGKPMENIIICTHEQNLAPEKKTSEAMCWDIKTNETFTLQPGELKLIKSGIKTFIPIGRCCKMYARSSLPLKNGVMLANSVGLIDSDYRGEYLMQMLNITKEPLTIERYTRLCQLEFCPHHWGEDKFGTPHIPAIEIKVDAQLFEKFSEVYGSERGAGGFGSTGKS